MDVRFLDIYDGKEIIEGDNLLNNNRTQYY